VRAVLVFLAVAAAATAGCAQSGGPGTSCAAAVRWNQSYYWGNAMKVRYGAVLGRGVVRACTSDDGVQEVTVRRVANVPPALAVARDDVPASASIYLASGFFPVLADHPLHRALVRQAHGLPRPRRCTERFRLSGTVLRTPLNEAVPLGRGGRSTSVHVVATTKIIGFRRAGYAYLQRRDLVTVSGRRCDLPDSGRAYVADVIAPAG
jgi:hypothetical protein